MLTVVIIVIAFIVVVVAVVVVEVVAAAAAVVSSSKGCGGGGDENRKIEYCTSILKMYLTVMYLIIAGICVSCTELIPPLNNFKWIVVLF